MELTQAQQAILNLIIIQGVTTPNKLLQQAKIGRIMLHRHLAKLVQLNRIQKIGSAPRVLYKVANNQTVPSIEPGQLNLLLNFDFEQYSLAKEYLNKEFVNINTDGTISNGVSAFLDWCFTNTLQPFEQMQKYSQVINNTELVRDELGLINFKQTSGELEKIWILQPTNLGNFGESKLFSLIKVAKEQESMALYSQVARQVSASIKALTIKLDIQAIAFIPSRNKTEAQLNKILEQEANPGLAVIKVEKLQMAEFNNQSNTLISSITSNQNMYAIDSGGREFNNVLLVDEQVTTGATLSQVANKIKQQGIAKNIYGMGFVGPTE